MTVIANMKNNWDCNIHHCPRSKECATNWIHMKALWRSLGHLWWLRLCVLCRHTHVSSSAKGWWLNSFLDTTRAVLTICMLMSACVFCFATAKKLPKNEPQAAGANSGRNRGVDLTETAQPTSRTCCSNWRGFCSSPSPPHTCTPALFLLSSPPQLNYI